MPDLSTLPIKTVGAILGGLFSLLGVFYNRRATAIQIKEQKRAEEEKEEKEMFQKKIDKLWEKHDVQGCEIKKVKDQLNILQGEHNTRACLKTSRASRG